MSGEEKILLPRRHQEQSEVVKQEQNLEDCETIQLSIIRMFLGVKRSTEYTEENLNCLWSY